jgi:hypothetical protein
VIIPAKTNTALIPNNTRKIEILAGLHDCTIPKTIKNAINRVATPEHPTAIAAENWTVCLDGD